MPVPPGCDRRPPYGVTSTAKWADLGIDAPSFANLPVDASEVVDHGPEVPVTYECARS